MQKLYESNPQCLLRLFPNEYNQIAMQKNKKLLTESARQAKRTLRIAESPKKVTKLKLSTLLEASKAREMDQINEAVRQKLQEHSNPDSKSKSYNPYETAYMNDLAHWRQYCESTERYQQGGINLKWPYYFSAQQQESHPE